MPDDLKDRAKEALNEFEDKPKKTKFFIIAGVLLAIFIIGGLVT